MTTAQPRTNIRVLRPSRKAVASGDIFAVGLPDETFVFGRVVTASVAVGPMGPGSNLIYVYNVRGESLTPNPAALTPGNLLIPPLFINRLPWSRGYFQTVLTAPIEPADLLPQHCFYSSARGLYCDEVGSPLAQPVSPCGDWALHSFRTVDDLISDAVGIARIPD